MRSFLVGTVLGVTVLPACNSPSPTGPESSARPGPLVDVTGQYVFTATASAACDTVTDSISEAALPFPDVARVRTYDAEVHQEFNGRVRISLVKSGVSSFAVPLQGIVVGNTLSIYNDGIFQTAACSDLWWEDVGPHQFFEMCGHGQAVVQN